MHGAVRVVVSGAGGRMGRTLARLLDDAEGAVLVGGIDRDGGGAAPEGYPAVSAPDAAGEMIGNADVLIDFSAPAFLASLLRAHPDALAGRAIVVGTTGLDPEAERLLEAAAERSPVLTAANFSIGVNLLLSLAEQAARAVGGEYDVEIVEAHHRRKEDAPSGTALALGEAVAAGLDVSLADVRRDGRSGRPGARPAGEIGFHAVRGGDLVGEHQVLFLGAMDRIELVHRASDRALFASGAIRAARWLARKPAGRYSMKDVLGLR